MKNKNIAPFAGSSLLEIKIRQLKRISELDEIVVNSYSDGMLEIAARPGAKTVKRNEYFVTSSVAISDVYEDMAKHLDCDTVLFAVATNPMIEDETVRKVIELYEHRDETYDSVMPTRRLKF